MQGRGCPRQSWSVAGVTAGLKSKLKLSPVILAGLVPLLEPWDPQF